MKIKYNVTGSDRKRLVGSISQELNLPTSYLGAPGFDYQVGEYIISQNGTLTGEDNFELVANLEILHGFKPIIDREDAPEETPETPEEAPAPDRLVIEFPPDVFTPESLDNLCKLVLSKEVLIKKAIGAEDERSSAIHIARTAGLLPHSDIMSQKLPIYRDGN